MDWRGCELVEIIPDKVSGRPLVKGTRIPADVIVNNFDSGSSLTEIHENYPALSISTIEALISFAHPHGLQLAS
jgi:uncharacterized protein (DUF433 family)